MNRQITLAMGNGALENLELIRLIFKYLKNPYLKKAEDSTLLCDIKDPLITMDSFTISPPFFSGGDIGKLSVAGVCNDLAVMGAKPMFLTLSFIIEEGFETKKFIQILRSIKKECKINGAFVVGGDTKVVPKGAVDQIFISASAVGKRVAFLSETRIKAGDVILLSGDIAKHGASVFATRKEIDFQTQLQSDCQSLWIPIQKLIKNKLPLKACRDATRGGIATVLNEWAMKSGLCFEIEEEKVIVDDQTKGVCEMLGLDPYILANEGRFLCVVDKKGAKKSLKILKKFNKNAAIIGKVTKANPQKVILKTSYGGSRFLEMPSGEILPRIC